MKNGRPRCLGGNDTFFISHGTWILNIIFIIFEEAPLVQWHWGVLSSVDVGDDSSVRIRRSQIFNSLFKP